MPSPSDVVARFLVRIRNHWLLVSLVFAACVLTVVSYGQCCTNLYFRNPSEGRYLPWRVQAPKRPSSDAALVVATQLGDNITWLDAFPQWSKLAYVTDDPSAALSVPANKGREGMTYLTYIIDNYERLPRVNIFSHSARYQWHNDDPLYDGQAVLARLNLSYVQEEGYVSLRCGWSLGCPAEIHPILEANASLPESDPKSDKARAGSFYKDAFEVLFPGIPVPEVVGARCCAQFAVTADRIRERPVADYQRYRDWLLQTPLSDPLSGRILEYSWHIIFNKPPVDCPNAGECYCKLFGLCGLKCETAGRCGAAYTLPQYATLPNGWPFIDWENNWRNATQLQLQYEHDYRRLPDSNIAQR